MISEICSMGWSHHLTNYIFITRKFKDNVRVGVIGRKEAILQYVIFNIGNGS